MGCPAPPKLPTINFSAEDMKPGSSSWLSTAKQVRSALEEYSSFVVQYDQISPELQNSIFGQAADLFEVPLENKVKNVGEQPYHGYVGPHPGIPLFESLCIDNVTSPQATLEFKNLMWPAGKKNFSETTDSFGQLLADLERTVGQMIFDSFGVGNEYESVACCNSHLLRFTKYKVPEDTNTALRFPMHTDSNLTTIVVQHDVGGLEVKTREGDWINIESVPSHFLFMAADGLQVWSNDRIKACQHRVKHRENRTRYSLGLFTFNNGVIQVPKELVNDEHPLLYNPCDSRGYTRFHASAESKKAASPIKAYCGVKVEN
ncbi:deoxypodophyllotoxin synthase-like [Pyrus communis]|uniref:deoxypodophyllotoxin synthase-like n=1 Tax=Pyrus communis TaxID=23211 RepID=UPI0035BEECAA